MPPLGAKHAKQIMNKGQQNVQNPVTKDMATEKITQVINQSGMPPSMLAQIGQLAENAIHNPKDYKKFVDFMVSKHLEKAENLKKPDYQMLASMAVIGKVASTMPDNTQQVGQVSQPIEPTEGL